MENPLPPRYYHTNFQFLLNFVESKYVNILNPNEEYFIQKFHKLDENAQCWFIRFTNRQGRFFKVQNLTYAELPPFKDSELVLESEGFINNIINEKHSEYILEILNILTKPELQAIFDIPEIKKLPKKEACDFLENQFHSSDIIDRINTRLPLIKINFEKELSFLRFLFFGNRYSDMTEFVLADLGLHQYQNIALDKLIPRFKTRQEAEDKWFISEQYQIFEELKKTDNKKELEIWAYQIIDFKISDIAIPSKNKLLLKIGKYFEQQLAYPIALEVFRKVNVAPAYERQIRILIKQKDFETAKNIVNARLEEPLSPDEKYTLEHLYNTLDKKKIKKSTTVWLQDAEEIKVPIIFKHKVEAGAIFFYNQNQKLASFSENLPWRMLFGLLFWDIIFDPKHIAFHHPFQRGPSDIRLPEFYEKRKLDISNRLNQHSEKPEFLLFLKKTQDDHFGESNPFVVWIDEIWHLATLLIERIPLKSLKDILLIMSKDINEYTRGFPDLLVWDAQDFKLIEIKGPNDTLSNQQLFWLNYFKENNISAEVVKLIFEDNESIIFD
ncbi:MAG: VRR-NUC domain-containing protein [Leadbetterella sp.]